MKPSFLVVDKPAGLTSHDVVGILRSVTGIKKVGHTGTLDPFATGVLPLAIGRATRFIQFLDESLKVYEATIAFGHSTTTGDPEGTAQDHGGPPDLSDLDAVLGSFVGERMQAPPAFSAVKVDGRKLYEYARAGVEKKARPRPITVYGMKALQADAARMRVRVECSRGTYVRVLGAEIAEALGTHGHLVELRRTRSGSFRLDASLDFSTLSQIVTGQPDWVRSFRLGRDAPGKPERREPSRVCADLEPLLTPILDVLDHLPAHELSDDEHVRLGHGKLIDGYEGRWIATHQGEFRAVLHNSRILRSLAG